MFHMYPRSTKKNKIWFKPQIAEMHLKCSAVFVIHNVRTGSGALEDVRKTFDPNRHLLAQILGFIFTNSFLAIQYFKDPKLEYYI